MTSCTPADPLLGTEAVGIPVFLLIGLLGGAHCLGMCGPLVVTYADRMGSGKAGQRLTLRQVRQHALFNLGRTATYALLGAAFGLAGELVFVSLRDVTFLAVQVQAGAGIAAGLVVAGVGIGYVTRGGGGSISFPGVSRVGAFVRTHLLPHVDEWVDDSRIVGLGAVHGFLPCPLLYPAFLYAFVQATPLGGAVALGALGLGTVPAVFLAGTVITSLDVSGRRRLHRALGVAFLALGYIPLQHGLAALGITLPMVPIPSFSPW